jgi:hypothetical protein
MDQKIRYYFIQVLVPKFTAFTKNFHQKMSEFFKFA